MFNADNKWSYKQLAKEKVSGQWTQKVYQVDDSPRYEGTGTWVYVDGKIYWESTTDAPLPRREYTIRSDYNLTNRTNRHEIVDKVWIHDEDNKKKDLTKSKKDGTKKMTDTGKEMTPVDMSPKMPKVKNERNRV